MKPMQKVFIASTISLVNLASLKIEARCLLEAVNQSREDFDCGSGMANIHYHQGNIFETYTFKERLKMLKQGVKEFSAQNNLVK